MPSKSMFLFPLFLLAATVCAAANEGNAKSKKIEAALADALAQAKVPGMVAAITSSEGVLAIGSAGVRKDGSDIKLTEEDHIHLGSCTKAMTSALMARLVAEGKLTWDTSLITVLPELKGKIHPGYHAITVW